MPKSKHLPIDLLPPFTDVKGETEAQMAQRITGIGRANLAAWYERVRYLSSTSPFFLREYLNTFQVARDIFKTNSYRIGIGAVAERVLENWDRREGR